MFYAGKEIKDHTLADLINIKSSLDAVEARRDEASQHEKFNVDKKLPDGRIKKQMEFPPPNPKFLELKKAINDEIEMRTKNV